MEMFIALTTATSWSRAVVVVVVVEVMVVVEGEMVGDLWETWTKLTKEGKYFIQRIRFGAFHFPYNIIRLKGLICEGLQLRNNLNQFIFH